MTKRVCLEPGCPTLTTTPRCALHARDHDRARGDRTARGYGSTMHTTPIGDMTYDQCRREYQRRLNRGITIQCWRCGADIDPEHWTLGHDDHRRSLIRGPECPPCNYATRGR